MQKNIVIFSLCCAAIITLTGCGAKKTTTENDNLPNQDVAKKSASVEEKSEEGSMRGSIKDLLGMGKAMKCTWENAEGMSGVTYVDGKRTYSAIKNVPVGPSGEIGESFVSTDDAWIYMWSSLSKEGTKMAVTEMEKANDIDVPTNGMDAPEKVGEESFDMQEENEYTCMPWVVDEGIFTPPTDITFVDMNAMMQQMQKGMPSAQDMAGICNMLTGEEKTACEAQMQ